MARGLLGRLSELTIQKQQQQQIHSQNPTINATTMIDPSATQNPSTSYTSVTTAIQQPKHDTTTFASDIFSDLHKEMENTNVSSSDTDADDDDEFL